MIQIIRADYHNPQHAQALISVLDSYARDPMGGGEALSQCVRQNLVSTLATLPHAFSILAFEQELAVGLVNCFEGLSTFKCKPLVNIHDIAVIPSHRSQGIGQLLLQEVEAIALEKGCCKLTLEVLQGNLTAQRSYERFGFKGYELEPEMGCALFWEKKLG